ncbi:MAG TPA: sulfotransferase [bacterium]|nr:sulfotransferase [bacterium]
MTIPDFFIVGAPRCGTTSLNAWLGRHPEIYIPPVKEMHFFGADLKSASAYHQDREKYLEQFRAAAGQKRCGEASVWYLYSESAPREMLEFNPASRAIIMLRNPVDMIFSLHAKLLLIGDETIRDFRAALGAEQERKRPRLRPDGTTPVAPVFYRETVKFTRHVKRWQDVLGQDRVHIIIYDDLARDPALTYKNVLRFLEVRDDFAPELKAVNVRKRPRSLSLHRFLQSPPPLAWKLRRLLVPKGWHPGRTAMRLNTPSETRPEIEEDLLRSLQREFLPEVEELSALLDRDLTHWCAER